MNGVPIIELLYFNGCPGRQHLEPIVQGLASETGARLCLRKVQTPRAAEAERFLGSPTVRVNGSDVDPGAAARVDYALTCRLYRVDGALLQAPPEEWIRGALERCRVGGR